MDVDLERQAATIWAKLKPGIHLRMGKEVYEMAGWPPDLPSSIPDVIRAKRLSDGREVNVPWEGVLATLAAGQVVEIIGKKEGGDERDA